MNNRVRGGLIAVLGLVAVVLAILASPVSAQVRQPFEWIFAKRLTVETTAAIGGSTTVGGALAVTGNASAAAMSVTGDLAMGGKTTTGTFLVEGGGGNLAVLDGGPLTAVRSFQQVSAAAASGMTVTVLPKGTLVKIINMGSNSVTITDTGTTMLSANAALGQYDSLTLISDGTNMIELARSNN